MVHSWDVGEPQTLEGSPACLATSTAAKPGQTSHAKVVNQSPIRQKHGGRGWVVPQRHRGPAPRENAHLGTATKFWLSKHFH